MGESARPQCTAQLHSHLAVVSRSTHRAKKDGDQCLRAWQIAWMKQSRIVVPWSQGLHLRPATRLVRTAQGFHSTIRLKSGNKIADLGSIFSVLALYVTLGTPLDLEAVGDDEQAAAEAVERVFAAGDTLGETSEER
jgi:phosphocarrier protein HPr